MHFSTRGSHYLFFLFAIALCLTDTFNPHVKIHTVEGSLGLTWAILPDVLQTWVYQPALSCLAFAAENYQVQEQVSSPKGSSEACISVPLLSLKLAVDLVGTIWVPWEAVSDKGYQDASGNCHQGFPYQLLSPFQLIPRLWARKVPAQFKRARVWFPDMLAVSGGCLTVKVQLYS